MPVLEIGPGDGLYYEHAPPAVAGAGTLVFVNALTGDLAMWEAAIAPRLRATGHGTLTYNLRGQERSPFSGPAAIGPASIVDDLVRLLAATSPERPILVGLSIGGLFAARAWLAGAAAEGLVLINTLRRDGPRLKWLGDALVRCAEVGGLDLLRDLYGPLLFGEPWQAANRAGFLADRPYAPIDRSAGAYCLLRQGAAADWDLPYERLTLPVLAVTGMQDRLFLDPADVAALAGRLPNGRRLDLAEAGHMVPAECPDRLADALLDFAAGP